MSVIRIRDINEGMERFRDDGNAVLLDVRMRGEYAAGRIPGSINLPLPCLEDAEEIIPGKDVPVYVYCLSGGRSGQAALMLEEMGYGCIFDIGGISDDEGELEM